MLGEEKIKEEEEAAVKAHVIFSPMPVRKLTFDKDKFGFLGHDQV